LHEEHTYTLRTLSALVPCPDLEDIAAFIDGRLPRNGRSRITEHLAHCESCYEVFSGAARLNRDLEVASAGFSPLEAEVCGGRLAVFGGWVTRSLGGRRAVTWGSLAAGVLVALGFVVTHHVRAGGSEALTAAALLEPGAGRAASLASGPWIGRTSRGEPDQAQWSFKLGVELVDLRLALEKGDPAQADETLREIDSVLERSDLLVAPEVRQTYQNLRESLWGGSAPRSQLGNADQRERQGLGGLVDPFLLDLGRWVEASRRSAAAHQPEIFFADRTRRLLDRALSVGPDQVDPDIQAELRRLRTTAEASDRRLDYPQLERLCGEILAHYVPSRR
jgi:Putative zinc-finger